VDYISNLKSSYLFQEQYLTHVSTATQMETRSSIMLGIQAP